MQDTYAKFALTVSRFAVAAAAAAGTLYILYLLATTYPDRWWYGSGYWPVVITLLGSFVFFSWVLITLPKLIRK